MLRINLTTPLVCFLAALFTCSCDLSGSSDQSEFRTTETTIQSRGVAVPVSYVTPVITGNERLPLVLMAHGHGGSRHEGGGYQLAAQAMAKHGIASIRVDFPGCGDSTESFTNNNLSNMLLDLQAAREYAASQPEIDSDRVGLLGYSMGGRLVALLAEMDSSYKVMAAWAPAITDGAQSMLDPLGGPDAYNMLKERARTTGMAEYTTRWGTKLQLGYRWFTDLEETKPLESLATFEGPLLILYGDQDDVVPPLTAEAAIVAARSSSQVVRHVVIGADHGLGFYTNEPEIAAEVVDTTAIFLKERL